MGMTGSKLQLYNGICLIVVFFGCRILWGFYQSFNLYSDTWSAWTAGVDEMQNSSGLPLLKADGFSHATTWTVSPHSCSVPTSLLLLYLTGNTVLSFLNCYWFEKMIAAIRKRFDDPAKDQR